MPAALSSREACQAGYNCNANRVRRAFNTPGEPGGWIPRSKWGTGGDGRGPRVRRLQGQFHIPARKGRCAEAGNKESGELTGRGLRFEQGDGNLVGWCTPWPWVVTGCLRRISREEEERELHSKEFIPGTELWYGCGEVLLKESLWVEVRGRRNVGGDGWPQWGICYRPPGQGNKSDEPVHRGLGKAVLVWGLGAHGFIHLEIYWKGSTALRKPGQFLDSISDNNLKANARGANHGKWLLLLLTDREKLVVSVIWGCSGYEVFSGERLQNYAVELGLGTSGEQTLTYLGNCWAESLQNCQEGKSAEES